jgi:hypothetical protein
MGGAQGTGTALWMDWEAVALHFELDFSVGFE